MKAIMLERGKWASDLTRLIFPLSLLDLTAMSDREQMVEAAAEASPKS
jgi:hypothetical protein